MKYYSIEELNFGDDRSDKYLMLNAYEL